MDELHELAKQEGVRLDWVSVNSYHRVEFRDVLDVTKTIVWKFENRTYACGPRFEWVLEHVPDVIDGNAVRARLDRDANPFVGDTKIHGIDLRDVIEHRIEALKYAAENGKRGLYRRASKAERERLEALGARESESAELLLGFDFAASAQRLVIAPAHKDTTCDWSTFTADAGWARLDIHVASFAREKPTAFTSCASGWDGGDVHVWVYRTRR